ncbi:MAG TPA: GNAT family N-acetyltransferase [bacterium]|nr:GNAT family N-acetyltransferase [bacterium]
MKTADRRSPSPLPFPQLETDRLLLRELRLTDAPTVQRLAGDERIARTTFVPHPYEDGLAEEWIRSQARDYRDGKLVNFGVVHLGEGGLIGSIGLVLQPRHRRAELGYWIGVPYWGRGYCTEAARAVVRWGFRELDLHRVTAPHFGSNPASGRVLEKIGMRKEGRLREHYLRDGRFEDSVVWGILRSDPEAGEGTGRA